MGIGAALFYYSSKVFSTSTFGVSTLATPFLTIVLSFALLGSPMKFYYFLAAILMGIGILLQDKDALRAPERLKKVKNPKHVQMYDVTSAFVEAQAEDIKAYVKGGGRALAIKLKDARDYIRRRRVVYHGKAAV